MPSNRETRAKAVALEHQIEDVLVDVGISDWSWRPFATPGPDELRDRRRQQLVRELSDAQSSKEKISVLERLIPLGGFELEDGILELTANESYLFGHMEQIDKFGGLEHFAAPFFAALPNFDTDRPDWAKLERFLLAEDLIDATTLEKLDLLQLRRCLIGWQSKRDKQRKLDAQRKKVARPAAQSRRAMTPKEEEVYTLCVLHRMRPTDAAKQLKRSIQAVSKQLINAKRKADSARNRGRSVKALVGIENVETRGKTYL